MVTSELHTVTRLREACVIGHRVTRAYSEWRKRGRAGVIVSAGAYPLMWLSYTALTCIQANDTIHAGVASMIIPNPVARPSRRLWRGIVTIWVITAAIAAVLVLTPSPARPALYALGGLVVLTWLAEVVVSWRIGHEAGSPKATAKRMRRQLPGPLVCGSTFAAWPNTSGQAGPLLDAALEELQRDGISLLVQARDDELAATYQRQGAVRATHDQPRHLLWQATGTARGDNPGRSRCRWPLVTSDSWRAG